MCFSSKYPNRLQLSDVPFAPSVCYFKMIILIEKAPKNWLDFFVFSGTPVRIELHKALVMGN